MNYIGILISGTRGSGKTAITRKLCEQSPAFNQCKAVTTRDRRDGDNEEYDFISQQEFISHRNAGNLVTDVNYGGNNYGFLSQAIQSIFDANKIPILIVAPECIKTINDHEQKSNRQYFSVFIDCEDSIIEDRLLGCPGYNKIQEEHQRIKDRNHEKEAHYSIKNNHELQDIVDLIFYLWEFRNIGGLLPKKAITLLIKGGLLLKNADMEKIKGASYDLTLGDDYCQNGENQKLSWAKSIIVLEPGNYVIVSSLEIANFPNDIAGRYDITVGNFVKGIILSNGPQVDPGFSGALLCILFNSSNKDISLRRGDKFASIEFIKLIEPTIPYSGHYQNKTVLWDYIKEKSSPGVIFDLRREIKSLEREIDTLKNEKWYIKIIPLVISIFALIVAIYKLLQK